MSNFSIVLSDTLLKEFYSFKHNSSYDSKKIFRLLKLYQPNHITNVSQLQRIGINDKPLLQQLATLSWKNATLEDLVQFTKFKLILTDIENTFPKVNIFSTNIESNFSSTYAKSIMREDVKKHIKLLCENATSIFIYDKYFKSNWGKTKEFFDLIPRKSITFFYKEEHLEQVHIQELKNKCRNWLFKNDTTHTTYSYLHDRYLIIDNKIEIILTSGFDNLFDTTADFTYIVRDLSI